MADGFIEKRQQDYEARKAAYPGKKSLSRKRIRQIGRPEDEAL